MRNCILRELWYVPVERLPPVQAIKDRMKVTPIWFDKTKPKPKPIQQCYFGNEGYVGFPVWFGMEQYPDPNFEDQTSRGLKALRARKFPDPNHERAGAGQAEFMQGLIDHFEHNHVGLAKAGTGTGKTVSALNLAGRFGRSTLVITDREYLSFEQWIPEAKDKLGLSDSDIGIVQGKTCQYEKPFVAAVAKSLLDNEYDPEFYDAFGLVIFDELHKFGAREMSRIMQMFSARIRLGMTATDKRGDGTEDLYLDYFGPCQITAKADALPFQVKIVDYYDPDEKKMPKPHGMRMARLARDDNRNKVIVREIINLYNDNRNILIVGDDIRHLQRLEELCWKQGIPENETGQFSRERYILTKHPGEHKGEKVVIKKMKKARVTNEYLNWVKNHARLIFATYGMIKEGVDIPRLDAGGDATPRREATQVVGRLRRKMAGKRKPIWFTIRDRSHECFMRAFRERMKDYLDQKAEIVE